MGWFPRYIFQSTIPNTEGTIQQFRTCRFGTSTRTLSRIAFCRTCCTGAAHKSARSRNCFCRFQLLGRSFLASIHSSPNREPVLARQYLKSPCTLPLEEFRSLAYGWKRHRRSWAVDWRETWRLPQLNVFWSFPFSWLRRLRKRAWLRWPNPIIWRPETWEPFREFTQLVQSRRPPRCRRSWSLFPSTFKRFKSVPRGRRDFVLRANCQIQRWTLSVRSFPSICRSFAFFESAH